MSSRTAGSLPFHRMYKKTPEGVFLSDVFRCYYRNRFGGKACRREGLSALVSRPLVPVARPLVPVARPPAGRPFMQKSNAKPTNLENKPFALHSPDSLAAKLFISYSICAVKTHVLAFLRCFLKHFYGPIVSPVIFELFYAGYSVSDYKNV